MKTVTESERKYDAPKGFKLPRFVGSVGVHQVEGPHSHSLDATYFDTDDFRLARYGATLRRRQGGTDAGWHLKTPAGGDNRTEHQLPLTPGDEMPAELLDQVRAIVRDSPLRPVARLRTRRRELALHDDAGRVLALLADDRVIADADGDRQQWRELEVELVAGDHAVLAKLDRRIRAHGAEPARSASKLARALGDRVDTASPQSAPDRGSASVQAVQAYVREQRDAIISNDPAVRRGDPGAVHAMRVATRRLRSTLRTFRGGLWDRERTEALRAELAWLADLLGGVRDRQVMAARLRRAVASEAPKVIVGPVDARIAEHLDADLQQGRLALVEALDGARYFRLLDELDSLITTAVAAEVRGRWVRRQAARALDRADKMLDEAMAMPAPAPDPHQPATVAEAAHDRDEHLHAARRAYKRARYAVEVFVPHEGSPARRLVKRLTELQDILGDHQDAAITREVLREYADRADTAGDSSFSFGVLYARQHAAGEAVLTQLPVARRATHRPALRRWLR